jgi:hypothetical protein
MGNLDNKCECPFQWRLVQQEIAESIEQHPTLLWQEEKYAEAYEMTYPVETGDKEYDRVRCWLACEGLRTDHDGDDEDYYYFPEDYDDVPQMPCGECRSMFCPDCRWRFLNMWEYSDTLT